MHIVSINLPVSRYNENIAFMARWKPIVEGRAGTRARALVEAIREDIAAGLLKLGDRLPPQRELACALGLSPNTVMRAYAEAASLGYVRGEVGRGTYVRPPAEWTADRDGPRLSRADAGPIDFSLNLGFLGDAGEALADTLATIVRAGGFGAYLDHQPKKAEQRHRQAGATWIGWLGLAARTEQIVLTNGAQQGISASLLATLRSGDLLLTEKLTYAPLKGLARHQGVRIVGLAMDEEGLLPDALEAACRQRSPKALYCTPTLQTPTTATMTEDRRRKIARIAEAHDLIVIEDDVFGLLPTARPAPLAAFAPERTILVTGLSKSTAPGLRVGYVRTPERLAASVQAAVILQSWLPPPLMGEIASRWIADGAAAMLNDRQRAHAERRQAMARHILSGHSVKADPQGMHLWLSLPEHWSAETFAVAAERVGVLLQPASRFLAAPAQTPAAVRLCLSHETSDARAADGLNMLVDLLEKVTDAKDLVL
jgi:DNA-binding transcriptional MocR family regulator